MFWKRQSFIIEHKFADDWRFIFRHDEVIWPSSSAELPGCDDFYEKRSAGAGSLAFYCNSFDGNRCVRSWSILPLD